MGRKLFTDCGAKEAVTYLLDTHTFLWCLLDPSKIPSRVRGLITNRNHQVLVSSVSAWEIATKFRLGRLPLAKEVATDIAGWVSRLGFAELPVTIMHAQLAGSFPQAHRDPFDRMLAAQSVVEHLPIVGCDRELAVFGASLLW